MSQGLLTLPRITNSVQSQEDSRGRVSDHLLDSSQTIQRQIYSIVRDLIPAALLVVWPVAGSHVVQGNWQTKQFNLLDFALIMTVTLLSQRVGAGKWTRARSWVRNQITANSWAGFCTSVVVFATARVRHPLHDSLNLAGLFLLASNALALLTAVGAHGLHQVTSRANRSRRDVLLIGSGPMAQILYAKLKQSSVYRVVGIVDCKFAGSLEMYSEYLGGIADLENILKGNPVEAVYCALPLRSMYDDAQEVVSICAKVGTEVRYSTELFQSSDCHPDAHTFSGSSFALLRTVRRDTTLFIKRAIDIAVALILLLGTAPIVAAGALAIKLTSPGPVFFCQQRCGLDRRRFRMFKLRTMVANAELLQARYESCNELDGPVFKITHDPRLTPVGSWLRRSSIDELPQLWNVLKGDMSLVGPRPLAVRDFLRIEDSRQLRRFSVKPGITCLWQVNGRSNTTFKEWVRQDMEYIEGWSLLLDAGILLRTIPAVLSGRGAV